MDDATNEHYWIFFGASGTVSRFQGVREVIEQRGLFACLYTDRGSHSWHTPEAGGKVDKAHLRQFGQAMKRLGIELIPAYSPEARGRSERAFRTHQERLPQEWVAAGITTLEAANRYLRAVYRAAFNGEFQQPAMAEGSAFVPWIGGELDEQLCERFERVVGHDNCVRFETRELPIPPDHHRRHYVKARVQVLRHLDGTLSIVHGPRRLARYGADGVVREPQPQQSFA